MPDVSGTVTLRMLVSDSSAPPNTSQFIGTLSIDSAPIQIAIPLPDATLGQPYIGSLQLNGGMPPYTWTLPDNSDPLPAGLGLGSDGLITRVPTEITHRLLQVEIADSSTPFPVVSTHAFSLAVLAQQLIITPVDALPPATVGILYAFQFNAVGGISPYVWTINNLPAGLIADASTGLMSGTPTALGDVSLDVTVQDAAGVAVNRRVALTVGLPDPSAIAIRGLPDSLSAKGVYSIQLTVVQPYPVELTGTLTLRYSNQWNVDDPSVHFADGSRSTDFTIAPGDSIALFQGRSSIQFQTGTVAGLIEASANVATSSTNFFGSAAARTTLPLLPPVLENAQFSSASGNLSLVALGYSTAREITFLKLTSLDTKGAVVDDHVIDVSSVVANWYARADTVQYGSEIRIVVPIAAKQGDPAVSSVRVLIANSQGASGSLTVGLPQ